MNQSLEGLSDLPESQKNELLQKIEEMQVRDRSVDVLQRIQTVFQSPQKLWAL